MTVMTFNRILLQEEEEEEEEENKSVTRENSERTTRSQCHVQNNGCHARMLLRSPTAITTSTPPPLLSSPGCSRRSGGEQ
ncbi:hypothetical protein E2C01_046645 [Portunus trituberculatus]|uniref:Uncharacterized protein n=1 Tax=Portunus trituberculatus TaxID=210409 RepID=A0A5B7G5D2_PORTR|nr:hypothetical protein [Portunus trituberculatus]